MLGFPGGSVCKESENVSHSVVSDSLRPNGLSMGFSRQEYWSELPLPPPGDLADLGIKPSLLSSCIGRWVLYHCATWDNWITTCKRIKAETSLVGQWSKLCASTEGDASSILVQETKIPHAKPHSQKKEKKNKVDLFPHNTHVSSCKKTRTLYLVYGR